MTYRLTNAQLLIREEEKETWKALCIHNPWIQAMFLSQDRTCRSAGDVENVPEDEQLSNGMEMESQWIQGMV